MKQSNPLFKGFLRPSPGGKNFVRPSVCGKSFVRPFQAALPSLCYCKSPSYFMNHHRRYLLHHTFWPLPPSQFPPQMFPNSSSSSSFTPIDAATSTSTSTSPFFPIYPCQRCLPHDIALPTFPVKICPLTPSKSQD